ncbi:metal-sensing transcriptional repressor [Niallia oryzisoli]|uniref:metal-sensing transcriptional repressor n=1 Tax=Niallia oryzisoli TaxID=1737571 RepID=UPI0037366BB3
MLNFYTSYLNSENPPSKKATLQDRTDLNIKLEIVAAQIRTIKNQIKHDCYYKNIIDNIVVVQTELDQIAYFLLEENVKACLDERIALKNQESLNKIHVTISRFL